MRAGLGGPQRRPDPTSSGQGEAERHVPLSVRLLDHPGQHPEAAVHPDRGNANKGGQPQEVEIMEVVIVVVIFSVPLSSAGHPVVRCSLLHLLLPSFLLFNLPSRLPPSNPAVPVPGCPFPCHRAWRRCAPGSLDPDGGALPADRSAGETPVPPVGQEPESGPGEAKDALRQQPVGLDGS